jgi:hypothetical protein
MVAPERWQDVVDLLLAPVAWVPRMQEALLAFFMTEAEDRWLTTAKLIFLLLPALLGVAATWITLVSLYTLPFRSGRVRFVSMMLLAWWDAARAVCLYWIGIVRVAAVMVGWGLSLVMLVVRLAMDAVRQLVSLPFLMPGRLGQSYFQPGVPWIAFVLLLGWSVLEATVFSHTMLPTVSGVLSELSGTPPARVTGGVLFVFVLMLVLGSFACLQGLADAVRSREGKFLAQMVVVEVLVMFFEVMFLYREFVDAISPWIARDAGIRLGFWATMAVAGLGWLGTRCMTWFLFARYGTAPLLAFIARRPLAEPEASARLAAVVVATPRWWRQALADFQDELEWLHTKGEQLLEYLTLPALQVFAAALNFALVIVASRPAFQLPFKTMKEVTETRDILASFHLVPRKQSTA